MRKIYFVMIFAALLLMLFAVSCDFNIFEPLEEIEVPSAPIPQRATNSAGIDVVEDAELLNIIERLEYKDGTLEKVTHTFEIDGKTVSYNAEEGMLQIGERVGKLSKGYFTKFNGKLFNHGVISESYLKFSHVSDSELTPQLVSISPIEDTIEELYGHEIFKLTSIKYEVTNHYLTEPEKDKGVTNRTLVLTGEVRVNMDDNPVKTEVSIYLTWEEYMGLKHLLHAEYIYTDYREGMEGRDIDLIVSAIKRNHARNMS
jgi:hypothetical protein